MLSDNDLIARLDEIRVISKNPNFPFDPETQIQPCSIDLRMGDVVWIPRCLRYIDLSNRSVSGPQIANAFRRRTLTNKGILLWPGRFVLARTLESFAVPNDLVARLIGRSSIGRLGISVVAPSNFINPGWRGHMPLMLINHSPFLVRVKPCLSIVQLSFFKLSSEPKKTYGDGTRAKYQDDDGGPSRFWLDWSVVQLEESLGLRMAGDDAHTFLSELASELSDEPTRRRLRDAIKRHGTISDPWDFVEFFVRRERRRSARNTLISLLVTVPIAFFNRWILPLWETGIGGRFLVAASIVAPIYAMWQLYRTQLGTAFSPNEIRRIAQEIQRRK